MEHCRWEREGAAGGGATVGTGQQKGEESPTAAELTSNLYSNFFLIVNFK